MNDTQRYTIFIYLNVFRVSGFIVIRKKKHTRIVNTSYFRQRLPRLGSFILVYKFWLHPLLTRYLPVIRFRRSDCRSTPFAQATSEHKLITWAFYARNKFLWKGLVIEEHPRVMPVPIKPPNLLHAMYNPSQIIIPSQHQECSICFTIIGRSWSLMVIYEGIGARKYLRILRFWNKMGYYASSDSSL